LRPQKAGKMSYPLKIATWNVNGLRARTTQFAEWMAREQPDVVCLQELKAAPEQIPAEVAALEGYHCRWHGGKGYSGVSLHVAKRLGEPIFTHPDFDFENRIMGAELADFVFYSTYVPNGGKDFPAKMRFLESMETHLKLLAHQGRQVVLCGDLNVARAVIDVHPKENKPKVIGQSPEERALFERILESGYVDVQRKLHPDDAELFTWWAPWRQMRERNIGWRIDYILASNALAERATSCVSQREVGTSDHGPVVAIFT
jgi:exodeoxyribonuclease-3